MGRSSDANRSRSRILKQVPSCLHSMMPFWLWLSMSWSFSANVPPALPFFLPAEYDNNDDDDDDSGDDDGFCHPPPPPSLLLRDGGGLAAAAAAVPEEKAMSAMPPSPDPLLISSSSRASKNPSRFTCDITVARIRLLSIDIWCPQSCCFPSILMADSRPRSRPDGRPDDAKPDDACDADLQTRPCGFYF